MKIRADLKAGDYRDPGWYEAPAGSVAYPYDGEAPPAVRDATALQDQGKVQLRVKKPSGPMAH
jgi:hypothetical protein